MPKGRANGRRWPGLLQSSKDRAKAIIIVFVGESEFRRATRAAALGRTRGIKSKIYAAARGGIFRSAWTAYGRSAAAIRAGRPWRDG
jgi:hypothetical protein